MMMGYDDVSEIANSMEGDLEKAVKGKLALTRQDFDILFKAVDAIRPLLDDKLA
jgi:chemotaxis protein histidine kinase CheA